MTTLRGIDESHWSGEIDWPVVRANGILFAIGKATEGTDFLDSQWANNWAGCDLTDMPYGAYHFYRNNGQPVAQADWFIDNIPTPDVMPVAVDDVETTLAELLGVPRGSDIDVWSAAIRSAERAGSKAEVVAAYTQSILSDTKLFLERLRSEGYEPVIYSSPGFIKAYFGNPAPSWMADYPLWIAHIGVTKPSIPAPWSQFGEWPNNPKVPIWQDTWTLEVPGIPEAAVDGNLFTTAAGDLYAWFGNGAPYEEPGDMPNYIVPLFTSVRIRTAPWGTFVSYADKQIAYKVLDFQPDTIDPTRFWYNIGTDRWIAGWFCQTYE
jgi:GH25 family lysozyme M1 (1,4-beta-N-acetylmuramidase)